MPVAQDSDLDNYVLMSQTELIDEQEKDDYCKQAKESSQTEKESNFFIDKDGILKRRLKTIDGMIYQIVLPKSLLPEVLEAGHDHHWSGHQGFARTCHRLLPRFFIPKMRKFIKKYVSSCDACQKRKHKTIKSHSVLGELPVPEVPFAAISIDLMGPLNRTTSGKKYIIAAVDMHSRFLETQAVRNTTADVTINFILNNIVFRHGIPYFIHSDKGSNFTSVLYKETLKSLGIQSNKSSAWNPRANGLIERYNKDIGTGLAILCRNFPSTWDQELPALTFALNTSLNSVTKRTPFELVFARKAILPIDLTFTHIPPFLTPRLKFIKKIRQDSRQLILHQQDLNKRYHEKNFKPMYFSIGDKVTVKKPIPVPGLTSKFHFKHRGPYTVIDIMKKPCTYKVRFDLKPTIIEVANGRNLEIYHERPEELTVKKRTCVKHDYHREKELKDGAQAFDSLRLKVYRTGTEETTPQQHDDREDDQEISTPTDQPILERFEEEESSQVHEEDNNQQEPTRYPARDRRQTQFFSVQ